MPSFKFDTRSPSSIIYEIEAFERQYGTPTSSMAAAFTVGGELKETPDFRRWATLIAMARRLHLAIV